MFKGDNLRDAKRNKNDEFYTQLTDIEKEMQYYHEHLQGKRIFLNCDDPKYSSFWYYFQQNFDYLSLESLTATHFNYDGSPSYKLEIYYDDNGQYTFEQTDLKGNGDFRSDECLKILEESDVVVTNPPFSLFREYVYTLDTYGKKFIIIGNQNALSYKDIFRLIKDKKMWLGASIHSGDRWFGVPDDYPLTASNSKVDEDGNKYVKIKGVRWYTNLDYPERHEELILTKKHHGNEDYYPKYENFNAINVGFTKDIPMDYEGYIGVPITFMDKFNPDQFEIIGLGISSSGIEAGVQPYKPEHKEYRKKIQKRGAVDGDLYMMTDDGEVKVPYARILIQNKKPKKITFDKWGIGNSGN